ncbi:MAG: purine-binding chemotaxis protein CheW [Candidatus Riflebacteria bacterium]|nr:purine-binding chemotaxis protein CheW [Candidatus Riflebacteria bacterium]
MEPQVQEYLKLIATFFINDCLYGIDTQRLQEVVRISEITPVHHSPEYVLGVMNLRGRIVTVIDLGCKLLLKKLTVETFSRVFIVSWEQEYVGLLVDKIEDVVPMEEDLLRPPPENVSREQAAMFRGVFRTGEKLVTLLDLDTTLHLNRSSQ